jgi:hypothetical protein
VRIRTIKPEFFLHDALFEAEKESALPLRIAYIGLWCAADREGRFKWEPRRLGAAVLPYDMVDFSRVLDALVTRGYIERHASNGVDFGVIPSFVRHQLINNRESPSILPSPTEESIVIGSPTRDSRVTDACSTPLNLAKGEGKGREGKGKDLHASNDAADIYQLYPRKEARADAIRAIEKALRKVPAEALKEAVAAFAKAQEGNQTKFIPHPASWFNAERWTDDRGAWSSWRQGSGFAPAPAQAPRPTAPIDMARRTPMFETRTAV